MASRESILQTLKAAAGSSDGQKLKDAFSAILANLSTQSMYRIGLESLVVCAETAIQLKNLDVAKKCLETYFLEVRRYSTDLSKVEVKDQYLVRAHYALGKLVSALSRGLKGKPLIDGTLEAIRHVQRGLELAAGHPSRYLFLVYNGSVHHWHVSRPLQRTGLRHHLLPSIEQVWLALDKVPGHEEWKVRNLIALALCQAESAGAGAGGKGGGVDEATKTLQRAYDMAAANKLEALQKEVAVLQVHLLCQNGDVSKSGVGGGGGGAKAGGGKPGAVTAPAGKLDEEGALRMVQAVLSAKPADKAAAEQMLKDAVAKVDLNPEGSAKGALLMPAAMAAWAAAVLGLGQAAEKWASRAAMSQELAPRLWSDMTRVLLSLQAVPAFALTELNDSAVQVHIRAMESLDDVVTAFMKTKDVQGCHEAARLIWNAGLVLLQPNLRRNVKRAFNSAAKALEVVDSPLHRLRVALHLEAAKCDAIEDSLIKASHELSKAQALDYVPAPGEQALFQLERPLDRYLDPLSVALTLRTSLTLEPNGAEEEAVLLVERSKESRNPAIKKDLLARAIDKLSSLPHITPPTKDYQGADRSALQVACRRRTVVWAELIRSAWGGGAAGRSGVAQNSGMKMDESVLLAAPYCLHAQWEPEVDREMVMLQAEVSFMEAEAAVAALKKQGADVVPPVSAVPPKMAEDGSGLRLPSPTTEHLQDLVIQAVVRGMQMGLKIKEAWLVVNGAVLAWNTYLHVMHQLRYVDLIRMLEAVVEMLLQLDSADTDGGLVCGFAEEYAKALEHKLLLTTLLAPSQPPAEGEEPVPMVFRYRRTPGYELLPAARVKAAGLSPQSVPAAAAILANEFPRAVSLCEAALSKAGNAQSQALFESYARLQQFRGQAVTIPAGTSTTSEQTSRVVGIIEQVLRGSGREPELRQAMDILQALPQVNVELWAKLARAAAGAKVWPVALECSKTASAVMPVGFELGVIDSPTDVPELDLNGWFWLAVSETVRGQAIMSLVHPEAQDMMCCLSLRRAALESYVVAARFAGFVKKTDLVEHVARLAWDAALPFMRKPLLRASLVRPLGVITSVVNRLGVSDRQFQVFLNVVLIEAMASGRMWPEALAACDEAVRSIPGRSLHRPLLTWKAYCLGLSGRNVLTEMTRVKEYIPEYQGHTWAVLSHHSSARYDQLVALQKSYAAVTHQPWNKADYLVEYAEWLITSGQNDGETAEDVLLSAADALLEFDVGDEDGNEEDGTEDGKKKQDEKKKKKRLGKSLEEASLDPHTTPAKLTAPLLDRMMRIWIMLSQVANMADEHTDYMLTAHHYAVRMLTSAIICAYKEPTTAQPAAAAPTPSTGDAAPAPDKKKAPLHPPLPDTLAGWADYDFNEAVIAKLASDTSVLALAPITLPEAEVTLSYLDLLIRDLKRRGFDMHVLPLFQLQRMVAKLALKNQGMYHVATLRLCETLDELGLSARASELEVGLGSYWQISQDEEQLAKQQVDLQGVVTTVTRKFATGLGGFSSTAQRLTGRASIMSGTSHATRRRKLVRNTSRDDLLSTATSIAHPVSSYLTRGNTAPQADALPTWLQETAAEMAAGGVTTGGGSTSFGACNGVGGGSGTACSAPVDMSSGGLLDHVRSLLLLRPVSLHDVWLRKAEHLIKRGHYAAARNLLDRARAHAAACDQPEAEARAFLMEARAESSICNYAGAIQLIQKAQAIGGDYDFWRETVSLYVECRLSAPHTTTTDAREALQGGIVMFTTIARDDRAAEKDAMLAAAALKLQLSELLLTDMITMRKGGVFNWKKHYEQAVTLCGQVMAALAAREAGIPHIQALLHQSLLQMEDPKPDHDMRPRYKKIEKVLIAAEEMANKFVAGSCPRDVHPSISMPVARLLARVRLALAELRLMQARARDEHAADDRNKSRPKHPLMPTGAPEAEAVVVEFIDAMEPPETSNSLSPEDTALALAISAAELCNADVLRSKALLLAGQCLQYKFMLTMPVPLQPWPPRSKKERRRTVIGMGDLTMSFAARESTAGGPLSSRITNGRSRMDSTSPRSSPVRMTNSMSVARRSGPGAAAGGDEPVNEEDMEGISLEVVAQAETYQGQAISTLLEALSLAIGQYQWADAEQSALEIARCYGRRTANSRTAATQFLCIAQACKAVAAQRDLLLAAQPPQSSEALTLRQASALATELPHPEDSVHFQRLQSSLAVLGTPSRMHAGLGPEVGEQVTADLGNASGNLPDDLRAISFYISPDRSTLYVFALNMPDTSPPPASTEPPKTEAAPAKGKQDTASAPAARKMVLLDTVSLEREILDSVRNDLRAYRRNAEKVIRESIHTAVQAGWGREDAPKRGSGGRKGGRGGKKVAEPSGGVKTVFPPELNEQWCSLMWRMDLLLSPVMPLLKRVLPGPARDISLAGQAASESAASTRTTPSNSKGEDPKHKVVLLLDPELSTLPWEALTLFKQASSVTRSTSLYALRAGMQAVADNGGALDLSRVSYMVDTRYEGSTPEQAKGPYWTQLIPWFKSNILTGLPYTKDWKGMLGAAGGVPPEADALTLMEGATSLLWLGLGRFMSYVPPNVVSSLDLRGCDVAILLGRVNNEQAHHKQVYIDNRKSAAERALEMPVKEAELLLARGVKTVVTVSIATTAACNTALLQSIMSNLAAGLTVSEAAWKACNALECELDYQRGTVLVLGAPNLTASTSGAKPGGKAAAGAKKK